MANETKRTVTLKESLKQAIISIAIGTSISILTVLFQATIDWLNSIQPEIPGAIIGMAKYLHSWKSHLNA